MAKQDYYVISVESRKGGVGKTTAALCLAKLLRDKGWEVLLLDTDITGTNVTVALESAFWRGVTNIVEVRDANKKKKMHADLLKLFDREFMAGKNIPSFGHIGKSQKTVLIWQEGKVNIIGSEIYDSEVDKLVCKPSVLFDELHAFWFVKFIREVCNQFQEEVGRNKRTAIVIDNSPGYVGIGPAIQEWLTDAGVDRNKFLFVSSLDKQDLTACLEGIELLHSTYSEKWMVAKKLDEQKSNKKDKVKKETIQGWKEDEMRFAVRLLEDGRSDGGREELDFYLNRGLKPYRNKNERLGDEFYESVRKYQGIVVNRVPRRFKKGWWAYEIDSLKEKNEKVYELLGGEHRREISIDVMVEYSEYIESQFTQGSFIRSKEDWPRYPEELEWTLKSVRMKIESCREKRLNDRDSIAVFYSRLNEYQRVIDDLLVRLASVPMFVFQELVRPDWQPRAIGEDVRRWLWRAFIREFQPFIKEQREFKDIEIRTHMMEIIENIVHREVMEVLHKDIKQDSIIWKNIIFSGSVAMVMVIPNYEIFPDNEFVYELGKLGGKICSLEVKRWIKEQIKSKDSLAMFLAQEQLRDKEMFMEKWFMDMHLFRHVFMNKRGDIEFANFYESFTKAQSRILDLNQDVEFLISLVGQAAREEKSEKGLLPYIEGVAEKVIVEKSISHEQGMEEFKKGFRIAESLGQFQEVLSKIVTQWGLNNGI